MRRQGTCRYMTTILNHSQHRKIYFIKDRIPIRSCNFCREKKPKKREREKKNRKKTEQQVLTQSNGKIIPSKFTDDDV